MDNKTTETQKKVIDGLMTGKIHYKTPFERLEYKPITLSHRIGQLTCIALLTFCQFSFIYGVMYYIIKTTEKKHWQQALE